MSDFESAFRSPGFVLEQDTFTPCSTGYYLGSGGSVSISLKIAEWDV